MVENIEFQKVDNQFQSQLKSVLDSNTSDKVFVKADKTRNIYKMECNPYDKLLTENITQKYKRAKDEFVDEIDAQSNRISDKLGIGDRINKTAECKSFITLKDHKGNFEGNAK